MTVKAFPPRLFTSVLPGGTQEFACELRFTDDEEPPLSLRWHLQQTNGTTVLSGTLTLTEKQRLIGHLSLSALLPPLWTSGTLIIEAADSQYTFPVEQWLQPAPFHLPLKGFVLVLAGHRIGEVHRHARQIPSQQFGWDFLPMSAEWSLLNAAFDEQTRSGAFVGFGQPVLSPASGRCVSVIDGHQDLSQIGVYPDRQDFVEDFRLAQGNSVIIEHESGVFSCMAHLREGSLLVKEDDQVRTGQPVGQLGNSGFSSGPHLHLHFMDGKDILSASPLPVQLHVEGRQYAPLTGEILAAD